MKPPFTAYQGTEPYIFVSYAHADSAVVYPELVRLKAEGFNIWYDEGISPGESWREELANAIAGCSVFLIFVTERAAASKNCQQELEFSQNREKALLAVHLEDHELSAALEFTLGTKQGILKASLNEDAYHLKLDSRLAELLDVSIDLSPAQSPSLSRDTATPGDKSNSKLGAGLLTAFVLVVLGLAVSWFVMKEGPSQDLQPAGVEEAPPVVEDTPEPMPIPEKSIAVMPFQNLSPDEENAFFADGIHQDLQQNLSRISDLKLTASHSVRSVAEANLTMSQIGSQLRVAHVLQGSVRRSGEQVRISVQLIDADTDQTMWIETFDRTLKDVFAVQSEIASKIAEQLRISLDIEVVNEIALAPTYNMEAYQLYLQGSQIRKNSPDWQGAIMYFSQAIRLDPSFSRPRAETALMFMLGGDPSLSWDIDQAIKLVELAYELNPSDAMSLYAKARLASIYHRDDEAEDFYVRSLKVEPNNAEILGMYSAHLIQMGKYKEASTQAYRKLVLDPNSAEANVAVAQLLIDELRIDEAEPYLLRASELAGANVSIWSSIAQVNLRSGNLVKSLSILSKTFLPSQISGVISLLTDIGEFELSLKGIDGIRQYADQLSAGESEEEGGTFLGNSFAEARIKGARRSADIQFLKLLIAQNRHKQAYEFAIKQVEIQSDPKIFKVHLAQSATQLATEFDLKNNPSEARKLRLEAVATLNALLKSDVLNEQLQVKSSNQTLILTRALNQMLLGEVEGAQTDLHLLRTFSDEQPAYRITDGHFIDGTVHAMLGDESKALSSFSRIERESPGFYHSAWFKRFGLTGELPLYYDIHKNKLFQQIVTRAQQREESLRQEIRASLPKFFSKEPEEEPVDAPVEETADQRPFRPGSVAS